MIKFYFKNAANRQSSLVMQYKHQKHSDVSTVMHCRVECIEKSSELVKIEMNTESDSNLNIKKMEMKKINIQKHQVDSA